MMSAIDLDENFVDEEGITASALPVIEVATPAKINRSL
jgi:hypothetical protein